MSAPALLAAAAARVAPEVVATGRALVERGLVVGSVGNVSARVAGGFVITPTRTDYAAIEPGDLALVALDGAILRAPIPPSRECPLHRAVYAARPDVQAIVHTHSVHATAWSFLGEPLAPDLEECDYYAMGPTRTAQPAPAASQRLAEVAVAALGDSKAVLLARHGVLAAGATPAEALTIAEVVERQARVAWLLRRGA